VHSIPHVATLEVSLESPDLIGGCLLFRDFYYDPSRDSRSIYTPAEIHEEEDVLKLGEYRAHQMLKLCMFYTDIEHRVTQVTRGYRVSIEYEIIKLPDSKELRELDELDVQPDNGCIYDYSEYECVRYLFTEKSEQEIDLELPMSMYTSIFDLQEMDEKAAANIIDLLRYESIAQHRTPALLMSHLYPAAGVTKDTLRGFDGQLYGALERHFDIELMPVCLFTEDDSDDRIERCMSLRHNDKRQRKTHALTLFVTPTGAHAMETLRCAFVDNADNWAPHLNYTTMAMILNKNLSIDDTK